MNWCVAPPLITPREVVLDGLTAFEEAVSEVLANNTVKFGKEFDRKILCHMLCRKFVLILN